MTVVVGPEFIVRDNAGFEGMLLHDADQVDLFWKRIEAIEKASEEQRWLEQLDEDQGQNE